MSVVRAALLAVGAGRAAGYGPRLATGRPVVAMQKVKQGVGVAGGGCARPLNIADRR